MSRRQLPFRIDFVESSISAFRIPHSSLPTKQLLTKQLSTLNSQLTLETNTNVTSPLPISNLEMGTTYQWQVQGVDCDGNGTATDWSETATFTTPFGKDITGYGNDVNVKTG